MNRPKVVDGATDIYADATAVTRGGYNRRSAALERDRSVTQGAAEVTELALNSSPREAARHIQYGQAPIFLERRFRYDLHQAPRIRQ